MAKRTLKECRDILDSLAEQEISKVIQEIELNVATYISDRISLHTYFEVEEIDNFKLEERFKKLYYSKIRNIEFAEFFTEGNPYEIMALDDDENPIPIMRVNLITPVLILKHHYITEEMREAVLEDNILAEGLKDFIVYYTS